MDLVLALLTATFLLAATNIILTVVRTVIDWKLYKGSDNYWKSWKSRSKNIRKKLLKELSDDQLKKELKMRRQKKKT